MRLDIKKFIGKVLRENQVIGTGFLISNNYFLTARHNVIKRGDDVEEKRVKLIFPKIGKLYGKTINLLDALDNNIDCVLIELEEEIFDIEFSKIVISEDDLENFNWKSYGYPVEEQEGYEISGSVKNHRKVEGNGTNIDLDLNIDDRYYLPDYSGLSGAPVIIDDFIVGVLIHQATQEGLEAISFDVIKSIIDKYNKPINKKFNKVYSKNIRSIDNVLNQEWFKVKLDRSIRIAGPRYTPELTVNSPIKNSLFTFAQDNNINLVLKGIINDLKKYPDRLESCLKKGGMTNASRFTGKAKSNTKIVLRKLNNIIDTFVFIYKEGLDHDNIEFFNKLDEQLNELIKKLDIIFRNAHKEFEEEHGNGMYENEKWKGFMASYMCCFPTANLDTIKNLKEELQKLKKTLEKTNFTLFFASTLLLRGVAGAGKTHSLCDLIMKNFKSGIPGLLFFGQYFRDKSPEEVILEKLGLSDFNFEELLYKLNLIGERLEKPILLCIDALNETTDRNYWRDYLIEFIEKLESYSYVKLLLSCRNLYIEDILPEEIEQHTTIKEHIGFEGVEFEALTEFYNYYGLDIPAIPNMQSEFYNPLFLKIYCETIIELEKEDTSLNYEGINELVDQFLETKNKKISKKYTNLSAREEVIFECVEHLAVKMNEKNQNYLKWRKAKDIINNVKPDLSVGILNNLISENILKEDNFDGPTVSFAFEKFYDVILAKHIIDKYNDLKDSASNEISYLFNTPSNYKGVLEAIIILYQEKYNKELLNDLDLDKKIFYGLTLDSLNWRKDSGITEETRDIVEYCLKDSEDEELTEKSLFTILKSSLRTECILNAEYFHRLFCYQDMFNRDGFLGYYMLKSYERHRVVNKLLNNSISLRKNDIDIEVIELWEIVLCWFTSLNDIYIRDLASKGLVNLFVIYPNSINNMLKTFRYIDDDYIHERLWGAIYASLIRTRNKDKIIEMVDYININYARNNNFPMNALIRDYIRNIVEFANYLGVLNHDIENFRPPYESPKIDIPEEDEIEGFDEKFRTLYSSCIHGDYNVYTIPRELKVYDFTKKELGKLIFKNIVDAGYNDRLDNLDKYIEYTYGSLRNRDESVERVGKKYQKIWLNKIVAQIKDNYKPNQDNIYFDETEIVPSEQANAYRNIDLSSLPINKFSECFKANDFNYDFRTVRRLSDVEWFKKEDIGNLSYLIENQYKGNDFLLLKGDYDVTKLAENSLDDYPKRRVWLQIRSYLLKKEDLIEFKEWVKDKNFMGRWMAEGRSGLYEGWLGEYPWSPTFINLLEESEVNEEFNEENNKLKDDEDLVLNEELTKIVQEFWDEKQQDVIGSKEQVNNRFSKKESPVELIPTVNEYNNEQDSEFCDFEIGHGFCLPALEFFKDLNLKWNGENVYNLESKIAFINNIGNYGGIYINKEILDEYLEKNDLTIVWTVLGEKQVIRGAFKNEYIGNAEISQSYSYTNDEINTIHSIYEVNIGDTDG